MSHQMIRLEVNSLYQKLPFEHNLIDEVINAAYVHGLIEITKQEGKFSDSTRRDMLTPLGALNYKDEDSVNLRVAMKVACQQLGVQWPDQVMHLYVECSLERDELHVWSARGYNIPNSLGIVLNPIRTLLLRQAKAALRQRDQALAKARYEKFEELFQRDCRFQIAFS